jgi:hypothetical protein
MFYNIGPKTKWRSNKLERLAQSATDTLAQSYKTFYALNLRMFAIS